MAFLLTLLGSQTILAFPTSPTGRLVVGLGGLLYVGVIAAFLRRWTGYNKPFKNMLLLFGLLTLSVPLAGLFIGLRIQAIGALPFPGLPIETSGPALMIFAALPVVLAAGFWGPSAAAILGALAGLIQAIWDTHSVFTMLEYSLVGVLFAAAINQRYRSGIFIWLRHPIIMALGLAAIYPLIYITGATFLPDGSIANRLDFALTSMPSVALAMALELGLAGLVAEIIAIAFPARWGRSDKPLQPAPAEKSLQAHFIYSIAPLALILATLLMIGDWLVAERVARQILKEQMAETAQIAAEGVPFFLGAGQNLIKQVAQDERLWMGSTTELQAALEDNLRRVPFFSELYLLDRDGDPLAGYPIRNYASVHPPPEEQVGVQLALVAGVPIQDFTVPPESAGQAARVSFLAAMIDGSGSTRGVLIGRADLAVNPFSQPIINSLSTSAGEDGEGMLLDEQGQILYHTDPELVMSQYSGKVLDQAGLVDDTAPDGTRRYIYYQPAVGRSWAAVLSVPAQRVQQWALNIAAPLLGMIIVMAVAGALLLRFGLGFVTRSLQTLAQQAGNIARGNLEIALPGEGEDEVGQLRRAFEQMRISLKARLDELNQLLLVSQGVASSLEMSAAASPILESALKFGAVSARIVLEPDVVPDLDGEQPSPEAFGLGPASAAYAYLDKQILGLSHIQERVILSNVRRPSILRFTRGSARPHAIIVLALRHESRSYGSFWLAYDQPHRFPDEEVRFLATLAGQAALAAANAHLFLSAEIGRQRLAAILASTPDPVLVTDHEDRLLLVNPAAWRVLGLGTNWEEGHPVSQVIAQEDLVNLLSTTSDEKRSLEINMPDGRIYYAMASTVLAEGQRVGRVCVLRDISYFKELDALKSEFVATVSHDLRSPLTLMRGYATMLEMVGDLNEQQENYVRKIVTGIESMTRLVNNLLDLGRIEAGIELQLEMIPVRDLVERVTGALNLQATQKKVDLIVQIPDDIPPFVEADQALLQQALHNLVENAIKYTEANGQVSVMVSAADEELLLEVRDTGIGIAPVDQPHLFEKFFRVEKTGDKKQRGSGLGLAIVKSIADRHGGKIRLESRLGKGSVFYFSIPLRQSIIEN